LARGLVGGIALEARPHVEPPRPNPHDGPHSPLRTFLAASRRWTNDAGGRFSISPTLCRKAVLRSTRPPCFPRQSAKRLVSEFLEVPHAVPGEQVEGVPGLVIRGPTAGWPVPSSDSRTNPSPLLRENDADLRHRRWPVLRDNLDENGGNRALKRRP